MHTEQSKRVAAAEAAERQHDVYQRRGRLPEEVAVRAAVREAVLEEGRPRKVGAADLATADGPIHVDELTVVGSSHTMAEAGADAAGDVVTRMLQPSPLEKGIAAALSAYERGESRPPLIPPERQGWRGRLAHVEVLLYGYVRTVAVGDRDADAGLPNAAVVQALTEVRSMLDGDDAPEDGEPGLLIRSEAEFREHFGSLSGEAVQAARAAWRCHAPGHDGARGRCGAVNAGESTVCGSCGAAAPWR